MNSFQTYSILIAIVLCSCSLNAQQLAFSGAMGYGAYSQGGRGGKVIEVTNLNDSGPGSLRSAVEAEGPRTIVFRVSGNISLKSMLTVSNPYITIAGQTAPGDGICLKDFPLHITGTHDVVCRFIRVRPGIESGLIGSEIDGIEIRDSKNVIVDHCTISWTVDEVLNTWHGTENITVQWCMISEPLNKSVHEKGAHGFSASLGGNRASYLFNLFASGVARNPSIGGNHIESSIDVDFRNNVVFNYGYRTGDGKPRSINFAGNYYKPGPNTSEVVKNRFVRVDNAQGYHFQGKWFVSDNVMEGNDALASDNANGVEFEDGVNAANGLLQEALPTVETPEVSATKAYNLVLENVGVIVPRRDLREDHIVAQAAGELAIEGTGVINKVEEAGGWPQLKSLPALVDTDGDGMPDDWELKNGLDPNDAADGGMKAEKGGYTNLEVFLNQLAGEVKI
ncbi:pectate lyase [Mangrovibacterium lignilyticum]|uniref:pectate lyase n=1 Tax=Mangrovibacterium lignilyticum TaxID=2668052 RepID=UPI001EE5D32D|nr:pectate lyase [Mangrovibacterium lignilyticum]